MDTSFLRQQTLFGNPNPPADPFKGGINIPTPPTFGGGMTNARPPINPAIVPSTQDTPDFEHAATDKFNQLVNQYPQEGHIGVLRRIAAMAAGLGGPSPAQDTILHGPHNAAVADWERQIKPAGEAANMERYANALRGTTAYRGGQLDIAKQKADTQDKNVDSQVQARANRGDYLRWQMTHPNHELKLDEKTGHMIGFNPKNLSEPPTDLGEFKMSQREFADMTFENNKILANIRAENAQNLKAAPSDKTNAPLAPSQDQILTEEAYNNYYNTKQPGYELMKRDPDTKKWDVTGLNTPELTQGVADYVKNYRAKFNAQRGQKSGAAPKPGYVPKLDASGKQIGWKWGG